MTTQKKRPQDYNSCFLAKLGHYVSLSEDDCETLAKFEKDERDYASGDHIAVEGETIEHIYVVKHGWVVFYNVLPDGRRQNLRLYLPGDLMGMTELAYLDATTNIEAVTDATLCPFPKSHIGDLFEDAPRLAALFLSLAMRDEVALRDTIRMLGRMQTEDRLAHFLLETQARLRIGSSVDKTRFRIPMSQTMMADVIGASFVSVNRALRDLAENGDIARHGKEIEIVRWQALADRCDFQNRYEQLDTGWFPESA